MKFLVHDVNCMSSNLTGNPVVAAEEISVQVVLNQTVILRVHIAGDTQPEANDIQWYNNGAAIVTSSFYAFSSDRQSITIIVTNKNVTGIYECRVTTTEGMNSAFINVTFPGMWRELVYVADQGAY